MAVQTREAPVALKRGQAGGLALVRKHGRAYMGEIGRLGGRPRASTINDIITSAMASGAQNCEKEEAHRKGRKELLGLWKEKQASTEIITQGEKQ